MLKRSDLNINMAKGFVKGLFMDTNTDATDQKKLFELIDEKLQVYLNPVTELPKVKKGGKPPTKYLKAKIKENKELKKYRSAKRFLENEIEVAKVYQSFFERGKDGEYEKPYGQLANWITALEIKLYIESPVDKSIPQAENKDPKFVIDWNAFREGVKEQALLIKKQTEFMKEQALLSQQKNQEESAATSVKKHDLKPVYNSLYEIFFTEDDYTKSLEALIKVSPPVIRIEKDKKYYLLGPKAVGVFVAWFDVIGELRGKLKTQDVKLFIQLLNKEFTNLNMGASGRVFQNTSTTFYKKYHGRFTAFIP